MEQSKINNLVNYLKTSSLPEDLNEKDKNYILRNAYKFTIYQDALYYLLPSDLYCFKKVLNEEEVKEAFIQYHIHPLGGHLAFANTFNRIYQKYYWENMNKDIHQFIKECPRCQEHGNKYINEKAYPVPVPVKPFSQIGIDIKHVVTSQSGHRYIIVAIDYLTKYIEVGALRQQTASEITNFLVSKIICIHGCPRRIITDNGRPFVAELVQITCRHFGIKHVTISPYHSQSNGLCERINRTIDSILKKRSIDEKDNWPEYLDATAYAYRTIKQATTKRTPFYMLYGYEPDTPFDISARPLEAKEVEFEHQLIVRTVVQIEYLNRIRKEAHTKIAKAQKIQEKRIEAKLNSTKKESKPGFRIGDIVKLYRDNISTSWSGKIMIRWYQDNFCIQEKLRKGSYYIKNVTNPDDTKLRLVHGNRLKAWVEPNINWEQEANLISIKKFSAPVSAEQI